MASVGMLGGGGGTPYDGQCRYARGGGGVVLPMMASVGMLGGGGGTPYDGQCRYARRFKPHFRAWLDPLDPHFRFSSLARLFRHPF